MKGIYQCFGPDGFGNYEVDWDTMEFTRVNRAAKGALVPGFVDIHIHGGFGIDFMTSPASEIAVLLTRLVSCGYEGLLPTTVTATPPVIRDFLNRLPDHEMILGFHLEGPFISDRFPGAQPPKAITSIPESASEWDAILDDPRLRVVTLAPELPNALQLITRLMKRGVIVSMGHTNATFDEARHGYEFGAHHVTHMYNAMRPLHHREAGTVGYALSNDSLICELIYDRKHVCRDAAALLLKCKPATSVIAISDGTMASGMPQGTRLNMWGLNCIVGKGEVRLEDGTLAGSGITLLDAFKNIASDFGLDKAIQFCCLNPRTAMALHSPPKVLLEMDAQYNIVERRVVSLLG